MGYASLRSKSRRWRKPLQLHGLCIAAGVLFSVHDVPFFEGTVTIKEGECRWKQSVRRRHGSDDRWNGSKDGHTGGGQLFLVRRETDFESGLLSQKGYDNNYLAFRPSNLFHARSGRRRSAAQ